MMITHKSSPRDQEDNNIPLAAYCRYSCDLQRPASLEDQLRNCSEGARDINGFVLDEHIYKDSAKSGTTLNGRDGLNTLIQLAVSGNAPFKGIIVDDTSRLGRNVPDALSILEKLNHAGIFLYFVAQRIDSRSPTSRQIYIILASNDEQYSIQLAHKVHRGQVGRALDGYVATGVPYGYTTAKDEDVSEKKRLGRANIRGSRLEPDPEQASVVVRIFELGKQGYGSSAISRLLNREGIPSARTLKSETQCAWTARAITLIWKNEKYKGRNVWNKTQLVRNPETGKKQQRARPEDEWITVDLPSARIMSDELWQAANDAFKVRRSKISAPRQGGLSKTEKARTYRFSGLLICGECGGSITIIQNREKCPRYVCSRALRRQTTCNRRSVHREVLEERLMQMMDAAITSELPMRITEAILRQQEEVRLHKEQLPSWADIEAESGDLEHRIEKLLDLVDRTGTSVVTEGRLRKLNAAREECQKRLDCAAVVLPDALSKEAAEKVAEIRIGELRDILLVPPDEAKRRFALLLSPIKITQMDMDGVPFVRCETAFNFPIGHRRGSVSVPFAAELSAEKERALIFSQELLDSICTRGDESMTAQDLSRALGVSRSTARRWCEESNLPHFTVGPNLMVVPSEARTWLMARRAPESRLCSG